MSAEAAYIIRRDDYGVLLRYPLAPNIKLTTSDPTPDRVRVMRLRADRELCKLELIFDCMDLSDIGAERVWYAIRAIRAALDLRAP